MLNRLRLISQILNRLNQIIPKRIVNVIWPIFIGMMKSRNRNNFTQSVYGPWLFTNWKDATFAMAVTGRWGFKLFDLLLDKGSEPYTFIDVGANIGTYSLIAANSPNCRQVHAIEPNPIVYDHLQKNIEKNHVQINSYMVGVGSSEGKMRLSFKRHHSGRGSLLQRFGEEVDVLIREYSIFDEILDDSSEKRFFIKIDVEGWEPEVVRQLVKSRLRQVVDEVFIEISPKWVSKEDIDFIFESMTAIGLKEVWRSSGNDQYDVYFRRPKEYKQVELERARLGSWDEGSEKAPRYSICVCNYNMADTLERAMVSVVEQLDERFEVLVIDDGSSDNSVAVLEKLAQRYSIFRFIALPRESKRQLGETRNISIRAARGEYAILGMDADDVWQPYLLDLMILFHKVEAAIGKDFMLGGPQSSIGKRNFLLTLGPYKNIYRCEDRNLMFRLAERKCVFFIDYRVFRLRLKRPKGKQFVKTIKDVWSHTLYDMRLECPKKKYVVDALIGPFWRDQFTLKLAILRAFIVLPSYIASRFKAPIPINMNWEVFMKYREENRGTFSEIMERYGTNGDISFLREEAQEIFSYDVKPLGFKVD